jgi:hypothetical protein
MSIADKLTAIAENVQKVYDAGKAAGGGTDERFKALVEGTLEELDDDTITRARSFGFAHSALLKTATLNNLTTAASSFFAGCTSLETVNLPNLKSVPSTGFQGCAALKHVYVPKADGGWGGFQKCTSLEHIDLPKPSYISAEMFNGCSSLKTIILRHNGTASLGNVSAFTNTPFRNGEGGTIYVPQAYVESYKTATNWNALESTTFLPIEGSEYE